MVLIELLHKPEISVKFFGNVNINYRFLFASIGMMISNLIILVQSEIESGKKLKILERKIILLNVVHLLRYAEQ